MASSPLSAPEEERSHSDAEDNGGGGGLPEDQVFELLTRVPLDDLPACRMVSTRWRRLTYEPAFAPLHCLRAAAVSGYLVQSMTHNLYHADFVSMHGSPTPKAISLDFLPSAHVRVEAVSAHRGLACCLETDTARPPCYYVCKPASRQWRALPSPRVRFRTAAVAMVARPSASSTTAEFKVVRFSVLALRGFRLTAVRVAPRPGCAAVPGLALPSRGARRVRAGRHALAPLARPPHERATRVHVRR